MWKHACVSNHVIDYHDAHQVSSELSAAEWERKSHIDEQNSWLNSLNY